MKKDRELCLSDNIKEIENTKNIESADVYIRVKNPKNTFAVLKRYSDASYETGYNPGLLRLTGISVYSSYYSFITTIAVIVIVLVVGASVLLIYNSFVISKTISIL